MESCPQTTLKELTLAANTIRMLAADGVEKAKSGHPGMPMGMAELAAVLWLKHLNFNPEEPKWVNRDRFVLSNGHGSMLLYSMLHLSGYDVSLADLQQFRQWDSKTAGHPESHLIAGVECTTGPLGQGISNAVGMALGQKLFATRYNTEKDAPFKHRIFCFVGDGCLMEGVSSEASSIAGHLGLDNLVVIYDDNHISIAGDTNLAFTEDVLKRYDAYGWHTMRIDGHDVQQIDQAFTDALALRGKPVIIAARTIIGKGSPNKADSHDVHGSPLGASELQEAKKKIGWPTEEMFYIPQEVKETFANRRTFLKASYKNWQKVFVNWRENNLELAKELDSRMQLETPADLHEKLLSAVANQEKPESTRKLSGAVLQAAANALPYLIGGSADLEPSTLTLIKGSTDVSAKSFNGRNIRFGVREHGMGAIMNGLAYYGGFIPYGSTFLTFADYMRPTIRLAALSHLPSLFIFTHDSIFLGEDGPTHQPIEHLASLRIIPNLLVFRPADGAETAASYALALSQKNRPSVLAFTRQDLRPLDKRASLADVAHGGYTTFQVGTRTTPDIVFVATGSEVTLALDAAKGLPGDLTVRVVSMPCWDLYQMQSEDYKASLIPHASNTVVVEAGTTFGWTGMIGSDPARTLLIGIDTFGASAPAKVLAEKFGLTPSAILEKVKSKFGY